MSRDEKPIILSDTDPNSTGRKPNEIITTFPTPFQVRDQEVGLIYFSCFYSWFNISDNFGNRSGVSYILNDVEYSIVFPSGFYGVGDISYFIQKQMKDRGHYCLDREGNEFYFLELQGNTVYYTTTITCKALNLPVGGTNPAGLDLSGKVVQLKITNANFGKLIGYAPGVYPSTASTTTQMFNGTITQEIHPVSTINVCLPGFVNNRFSPFPTVISTFTVPPNTSFTTPFEIKPAIPIFFPVLDGSHQQIRLELRDQNFREIEMRDHMFATLLVRRRV